MTTITEPQTKAATADATPAPRQFVNFMFFEVDRAFRRETGAVRAEAKAEFAEVVSKHTGPMMVLPYSMSMNISTKDRKDGAFASCPARSRSFSSIPS